jgi:pimeloyl-ACP methyl ester carboxylesterase
VLGSMGVYRAAFTSIGQVEALMTAKVKIPIVAMGGASEGLGAKVGEMVRMVAGKVETVPDSSHFLPEENPQAVIRQVLAMAAKA